MGLCPQTPEVYPLWEYPVKMKKSSNISVTALHRFIPQPASGRSLALPCLDCIFSMVRILAIIAFTWFDFQNPYSVLLKETILGMKCAERSDKRFMPTTFERWLVLKVQFPLRRNVISATIEYLYRCFVFRL